MKRTVFVILAVLLCALACAQAFAGQFLPAEATLASNANLRAGPSTETQSKMILMKGYKVTVVGIEGRWLEVRYGNFSGYIRSDLIVGDFAPDTPSADPTAKPIVTDGGNRTVLKLGMRGTEVTELQYALDSLGYIIGRIDGIFGQTTKDAVIAFQRDYGIIADGIVGKSTHAMIDYALTGKIPVGSSTSSPVSPPTAPPSGGTGTGITRTLKSGMTGSDVLLLNQRLQTLGYLLSASSTYNATAVRAFQSRNGLVADGIAGPKTQAVLFSTTAIPVVVMPTATTGATAAPTFMPPAYSFTRTLRAGMTGDDVLAVNQRLQALGYLASATSFYNENAIAAFQSRNGLTVDGITGAMTLNRLLSNTAVGLPQSPTASPTPTSATTAAPTATAPAYSFTRTLRIGMFGDDVLALNQRLLTLGYLSNATNMYNAAAVKAFQQRNGLTADSIAGPLTISRLFSTVAVSAAATPVPVPTQGGTAAGTLQYGSKGEAVRTLQRALYQLGYYKEGVDGDYGAGTRMAISLFQKQHRLPETGVADPQTQTLLYSGGAFPAPAPTPFVPQYPNAGILSNPPSASQVINANWDREIKPRYANGQIITVYDYNAGLGWQLRIYAMGEHADSDPVSAQDTEVMFRAFGLKNTWTPRPVWAVMPDGRVYMASIHNMPHLTSGVKDNGFDGHLCLHFPRDMSAAQAVGSYAVTHQNCISAGWQATLNKR